ncbi:mitogen-activated protein kinase kinase kinase [Batrachochytrium dendrobatidis]|nr:mitogen-activated protein kinase kinase kinase [Batrachochytrium dendrobatidis]
METAPLPSGLVSLSNFNPSLHLSRNSISNMPNTVHDDGSQPYRDETLAKLSTDKCRHPIPQSPQPPLPKGSWKRIFKSSSHVSVIPSDEKPDSLDSPSEPQSRTSTTSFQYTGTTGSSEGFRSPHVASKLGGLTTKLARMLTGKNKDKRFRSISHSVGMVNTHSDSDGLNDADQSGANSSAPGTSSMSRVKEFGKRFVTGDHFGISTLNSSESDGTTQSRTSKRSENELKTAVLNFGGVDMSACVDSVQPTLHPSTHLDASHVPIPHTSKEMENDSSVQPIPQSKPRPTSVIYAWPNSSPGEEKVLTVLTGGSNETSSSKSVLQKSSSASLLEDIRNHAQTRPKARRGTKNRFAEPAFDAQSLKMAQEENDDIAPLTTKRGASVKRKPSNINRAGSKLMSNTRSKSIISLNFEEQFGRPSADVIANNLDRYFPGISDIRVDILSTEDDPEVPCTLQNSLEKDIEHTKVDKSACMVNESSKTGGESIARLESLRRNGSPTKKLVPTTVDMDESNVDPNHHIPTLNLATNPIDKTADTPYSSCSRESVFGQSKSCNEIDTSIENQQQKLMHESGRSRPTSMLLSSMGESSGKSDTHFQWHSGPTLTLKDIVQTAITANQTRRGSIAPSSILQPVFMSEREDSNVSLPSFHSTCSAPTHRYISSNSAVSLSDRPLESTKEETDLLEKEQAQLTTRPQPKGFRNRKNQLSKLDTKSTGVISIRSGGTILSASISAVPNSAYPRTLGQVTIKPDLHYDPHHPQTQSKDMLNREDGVDRKVSLKRVLSRKQSQHRVGNRANRSSAIMSSCLETPSGAGMCVSAINPQTNEKLIWVRGELIGQGAFASVYLGVVIETGQCIAVKQVQNSLAGEGELKRKNTAQRARPAFGRKKSIFSPMVALRHELELLKGLNHSHVIQYLGFEQTPEYCNIFLEYVAGRSISSVLVKTGPFSDELICVLSSQTLQGLDYLHSQGIIHRDIKAANILVDVVACIAKITDFGVSMKHVKGAYNRVSDLTVHGTVSWMSPETVRAKGYTAKVDIWSFGCMIIEMTTGLKPWSELNMDLQIFSQLARNQSPPLSPNLSANMRAFTEKCFIIDADQRPTARELLADPLISGIDPYGFALQEYYTTASEMWKLQRQPSLLSDSEDDYSETESEKEVSESNSDELQSN